MIKFMIFYSYYINEWLIGFHPLMTLTKTFLFLGPFHSQKKILCSIPSAGFPLEIIIFLSVPIKDDLIIAFSVLNEALTTFLRKFNNVSKKIIYICETSSNSPDFSETFKKNFDKLVESESQKGKNLVNFYDYIFLIP